MCSLFFVSIIYRWQILVLGWCYCYKIYVFITLNSFIEILSSKEMLFSPAGKMTHSRRSELCKGETAPKTALVLVSRSLTSLGMEDEERNSYFCKPCLQSTLTMQIGCRSLNRLRQPATISRGLWNHISRLRLINLRLEGLFGCAWPLNLPARFSR